MTYEIMRPESVGLASNRLVLGKHSGRHAFVERLKELGVDLGEVDVANSFTRFKALADKKKNIYDEDLLALVTEGSVRAPDRYELVELSVQSPGTSAPTATVTLRVDGETRCEKGSGDGMVDACFKAISRIVGVHPKLQRYQVNAITSETEAQGEATCSLCDDGLTVNGRGVHTDVIMASALAYVNGLNKLNDRRSNQQSVRVEGP
jgi:2-isopropylmalate synthase